MSYKHESVREYADAKRRGDSKAAMRITFEITDRFEARTTDGSEIAELLTATVDVLDQPKAA